MTACVDLQRMVADQKRRLGESKAAQKEAIRIRDRADYMRRFMREKRAQDANYGRG
jgi:hypothetical protein